MFALSREVFKLQPLNLYLHSIPVFSYAVRNVFSSVTCSGEDTGSQSTDSHWLMLLDYYTTRCNIFGHVYDMASSPTTGGLSTEELSWILKSGVPGAFWSTDAVLLSVARNKDGKILSRKVYKSNVVHAEQQLVSDLAETLPPTLKEVAIISNFSPSGECAGKMCEWIAKHEGVRVSIHFAYLYNIHVPVQKVAEDNAVGLRKLVEKGVQLKAMSDYDWMQLLMINRGFVAKDEWIAKRKQIDDKNRKDLEEILRATSLSETLKKMRLY